MSQNTDCPYALLPTRRNGAILALLTAVLIPVSAFVRTAVGINTPLITALLLPWLFGTLVVMLERPGPVRNWAGPLLLSLFYPTLALCYDWTIVAQWFQSGTPPDLWFTLGCNVVLLGGFALYAAAMLPRHCPACHRRCLIPLRRLWRQERRTAQTRWCASCGAKYWKDRDGAWQKERRKTWLDTAQEHSGEKGMIGGVVRPWGMGPSPSSRVEPNKGT